MVPFDFNRRRKRERGLLTRKLSKHEMKRVLRGGGEGRVKQ